jgi:hypothetical protein
VFLRRGRTLTGRLRFGRDVSTWVSAACRETPDKRFLQGRRERAMHESSLRDAAIRPAEFWRTVAGLVTAKVEPVIGRAEKLRTPVIDYLRDLEALTRRQCDSRDTVQIIASGRRLLGDRSEIGPPDGPCART